jgi:phosphoribosyl-dephospho-CoA transferase
MTSLSTMGDPALRRHDMIAVSPVAWRSLLNTSGDLAGEPLVAGWVDRGWPLVARRAAPDEADGLPLGLPLPPVAGKRRLALLMQPGAVVSSTAPPKLTAAFDVAPEIWKPTLGGVLGLGVRYGAEVRVFGSLAWRMLTGLDYLTASSDLDLLLPLPRAGDLAGLIAGLAAIEGSAPMRLDGELVREDGAAVNWREIHAGAREVLVKTIREVMLCSTADFVSGAVLS